MSAFRRAFLFTAVPIVGLSLISMIGAPFSSFSWYPLQYLWFVPAGWALVAVIRAVILYFRDESERAAGILAGVAIGIVALGWTCFTNLNAPHFG